VSQQKIDWNSSGGAKQEASEAVAAAFPCAAKGGPLFQDEPLRVAA
jgi:hypothetical protein